MHKILIPTKNQEKLQKITELLKKKYNLEILSLNDIKLTSEPTFQKTDDLQEHTKNKSQAYADATNIPTLVMETALYLDALHEEDQPGNNIKKYAGDNATNEEVLASYIKKLQEIAPEQRTCRWFHTMCFAIPNEGAMCETAELQDLFIDTPHKPIETGYPLKSILFDPLLQKTHREYTSEEQDNHDKPVNDKLYAIIDDLINE